MHNFQRLILVVFLFSATTVAFATPSVVYAGPIANHTGAVVTYSGPDGNRMHVWPDAGDRRSVSNGSGGSVVIRDRVPVNTSRGVIDVKARSVASNRAIARGAAAAARALPYVGAGLTVGTILWDLLDDNGVRVKDGVPHLNERGEPDSDPWFHTEFGTGKAGGISPSHACNGIIGSVESQLGAAGTGSGYTAVFSVTSATVVNGTQCSISGNLTRSWEGGSEVVARGAATSIENRTGQICPLSIDSLDPSNSVPKGELKGPDGKCRTGRYNKPLTDGEVIDIIAREVDNKKDKVPLVNDILGTPGGAIELDPGSSTTSGPSSQSGTPPAPVVTTGPGGSVTTTESPGIAIRYRGREIEWEPQEVTTRRPGVNPGDPDIIETTQAPDEPSADPQAGATPDYCLTNPKRAGCSELGDVEPPEWNPDEKPIELKAGSPWGSDNASCPPPRTLVIGGKQYQWEWTLVCDFFSGVRFAVIASAWIAAVMIFIGARSDA